MMTDGAPAEGVRAAVRFVVTGHRRALAWLGVTAYAGGFAEAIFLVVARPWAAFAITDGKDRIGIVGGWFLSVRFMLALAFGLVLVRIGLAAYASWQSARLATSAVAHIRRRLSSPRSRTRHGRSRRINAAAASRSFSAASRTRPTA